MPDINNPLLTSATNIKEPDIPVTPSLPTWKRPEINVPESLRELQDTFNQMPTGEIPLPVFNKIVNDKLTPEELKIQQANAAAKDEIISGVTSVASKELPLRHFNSRDALRYKQNDRLWKEVGYNPEIPHQLLDAQYDYHETTGESILNTFPKFWNTTSFAFKNYFAEYLDTARAISGIAKNSDERFIKYAEDLKMLEDLYPDYKSDREVKWYNFLPFTSGFGDFWEQSAPSLGFTVGTMGAAIGENLAISLVTQGMGTPTELANSARKVFTGIGDYYSFGRAAKLLKNVVGAKGITGKVGAGIDLWRLYNGAASEAHFEGRNQAIEYLDTWRQQYIDKYGVAPSKQDELRAQKAADSMSTAIQAWETPFLLLSNAAQFGNIIAPKTLPQVLERFGLSKAAHKLIVNEGKVAVESALEKTVKNPLLSTGKKALGALSNSLWEGSEESYQALVTTSAQDYYNDKYFNKDNNSLTKSLGVGLDYITSNQGLIEFSAGFATGSIFKLAGKPLHWLARPKLQTTTDEKTGETKVDYKMNILNKLGFGITDKVRKDLERKNLQSVADVLNSVDIDRVFQEDGLANLIKSKQTELALAKFVDSNDLFNMRNAQNLQLNRLFYAGLITGKIDLQVKRMADFANQDFDTLKDVLGLDETRYQTDEAKSAFKANLQAFVSALGNKASQFEAIFNKEKESFRAITESSTKRLHKARNEYNSFIDDMMRKYNVEKPEDLSNKLSIEDMTEFIILNTEAMNETEHFYAINEAMKASVFSQVGMIDDANRARDIISELQRKNTVNVPYSDLGRFFDRRYRDEKIKDLQQRLQLAKDTNSPTIGVIQEQYDHFTELNSVLDKNFSKGIGYKDNEIADSIQNYLYAVEKEVNQLDNNTSLEARIRAEEAGQFDLLKELVNLQRKQQENLNLYNYISTESDRKDYINFQSKKINDFLHKVNNLIKEQVDTEETKTETKPEEEKKDTTTPPPPTPKFERTKENLQALYNLGYSQQDVADMTDERAQEILRDNIKKPAPEEDIVEDDEPDVVFGDIDRALAWFSRNKTVNREVDNTDASGNLVQDDQETAYGTLREEPYDQEQTQFIRKTLPLLLKQGIYKPYLVNDTAELQTRFITPSQDLGQVVVFMNDAGEIYKMESGKPAAFSFNENAFDKYLESRVRIRNERLDVSDSAKIFEQEKAAATKARELLSGNKVDRIPLTVTDVTDGVYETTSTAVPIAERFPIFEFKLIDAGGEIIAGQEFLGKKPVILVGKQAIEAITMKIKDDTDLANDVTAFLSKKYDTREEAQQVAQYLKTFVYVTKKNFFRVTPDNKIEFYKDGVRSGIADALNSRINIKKSALDNGYTRFTLENGKIVKTQVSKKDYYDYIKSRLVTNRKVIKARDGSLHLDPVNAYFSFNIHLPGTVKTETFEPKETPEDSIEAKKADIERRRQKEIDSYFNPNLKKSYLQRFEKEYQINKRPEVKNRYKTIYELVKGEINAKYDAELAALGEEKDTVKVLTDDELDRLLAMTSAKELKDEGNRLATEGIQFNPTQSDLLRKRYEVLKIQEEQEKKRKSLIEELPIPEADAPRIFEFNLGGEEYVLDFTKDTNNLAGKVPSEPEDWSRLMAKLKSIPGIVTEVVLSVNEKGENEPAYIFIGLKATKSWLALDGRLRRLDNKIAESLSKVELYQLNKLKKKLC